MNAIAALAALVRAETGIVLSEAQQGVLHAAVSRIAPGLSPEDFLSSTADPVRGRSLVDRLIDQVTVKETSFVRDRAQFDAVDWPGLMRNARDAGSGVIRVWSAGCATGEEPYTLAMLAAEALGPAGAPVNVLGTDVSEAAIAAAEVGRYGPRAVRELDGLLRQRYLRPASRGHYVVGDDLRGLVRFRRHNLVSDAIPPLGETSFDLIVCRNTLIYFDSRVAVRLIESFERSLRGSGSLMLGAADVLQRTAGQSSRKPGMTRHPEGTDRRPLRRPLGREPSPSREERLAAAMDAADRGDRAEALAQVASIIGHDPLDADAQFIRGLVALEGGDPVAAARALRRALYADADFALAAFTLGRAYDALGDASAARRSYERALRTLDPEDDRHDLILQQVDIGDVAAACRARLGGRS